MERETIIERTMVVEASPESIWKALTDPSLTKLYLPGWMPNSNWKRGAPLQWMERVEGDLLHRAKGTVRESLPGRRLRYTILRDDSKLPDVPSSYTTVDFSIDEAKDGRTLLHLWHGDFAGLPEDVKRTRAAGRAWVEALVGIKRIAEEQESAMAA